MFARNDTVPATRSNKDRAIHHFLEEVTTTGPGDPEPALRAALRLKVDLIYFVTDGDAPDNSALLRAVKELDPSHRTWIHTIAFVNSKDTDTAYLPVLREIAQWGDGQFGLVREDEIE